MLQMLGLGITEQGLTFLTELRVTLSLLVSWSQISSDRGVVNS